MMTTLKKVAERYEMTCLLHEKPFNGVNGSGKHVNFSIGNAQPGQPAEPRRHPARERAVPHLLRRDHPRCPPVRRTAPRRGRLGQQRLPTRGQRGTAGDHLDLPRRSADGRATTRSPRAGPPAPRSRGTLEVGVDTLPKLKADPGDRNRTSPFAFTGNRFEFRAPGSGQSISGPMVAINAILADSLDFIATALGDGAGRGRRLQRRGAEGAAGHRHRPRCGDLQRRRLLGGLAGGGGPARAEEPAHHARTRCPSSPTRPWSRCSTSTRCSAPAS